MNWKHNLGIGLISLGTLLLELTYTRVLSVTLWYHFGFLVISTALLGFGTSGVVLSVWTRLREEAPLDTTLAYLSIVFGITTVVSFWAMQHIPFDPFQPVAEPRQLIVVPLYYLFLAAPFFFSGLIISLLFTRGTSVVNRLYAYDLLGAGVGCAAIALVMPTFGGSGSVLVAAVFGFLAAVTFAGGNAPRLAVAGLALAAGGMSLAFVANTVLPIAVAPNKQHGLMPEPPRPAPLYTAWNTFSRIDVYDLPASPSEGWPRPGYGIVIDSGTAGTGIGDLSGGIEAFFEETPDYRTAGFAYVGMEHPKVLIIGSGAGRGVLEALYYEASSITAIEINPIINDVVSNRLRDQLGGLFQRSEVILLTDEGRSFVHRSKEEYDLIVSVQTVSNSAIASGALSLAENYMFTREAFEDFYDHLSDDGVLLITRPRSQLARLFATAREVFEDRGLGSPAQHLCAFRTPILTWGARHAHDGMLFKKSPFTATELDEIKRRLGVFGATTMAASDHDLPKILYAPDESNGYEVLQELMTAQDVQAVYDASRIDISPATDDKPFFNQQERWSNLNLTQLITSNIAPGAESVLVILLLQSALVAGFLILFPLVRFSKKGLTVPSRWNYLMYFSGLGLGFIMIEIVFLQRFTLFLGQPVYTFAVILASLLVFTGLGSFLAGRFRNLRRRELGFIGGLLLVLLVLTNVATPAVFSAALGLDLVWRVGIAVALIAPLAIALGMPFPTGLRIVGREAPALVPWAWGVNGFFTVIGSVGAMILGMILGFQFVVALAGLFYVAAFLTLGFRKGS